MTQEQGLFVLVRFYHSLLEFHGTLIVVGGTNIKENPYVKMGSYHTIELAAQRKFSLAKHEWDCMAIERLETACDPSKTADLAAVLMQEGLANLCLVTPFVILQF